MDVSILGHHVIPAQAGIQRFYRTCSGFVHAKRELLNINWIPACAGMTG
jgi:hypothetical protein